MNLFDKLIIVIDLLATGALIALAPMLITGDNIILGVVIAVMVIPLGLFIAAYMLNQYNSRQD